MGRGDWEGGRVWSLQRVPGCLRGRGHGKGGARFAPPGSGSVVAAGGCLGRGGGGLPGIPSALTWELS